MRKMRKRLWDTQGRCFFLGTSEIEKEEVKNFLKKVKEKFETERIILFGSRAKGEYLKESDYDFLIISKKFEGIPFRERIIKVLDLTSKPWLFDVLCYTPAEFEKKKKEISIVREAVRKGKKIKI
jgi:hypothetical protein